MSVDRGRIQQITQFLLPLMDKPDDRELWLTQAFYYTEPLVYHQLDRSGPGLHFVNRCIRISVGFWLFP